MMIHPCCGWSLRTGVKIVAIVEFVTSLFLFLNSLALIVVAFGLSAMYRGGGGSFDISTFNKKNPNPVQSNPPDIPPFEFWKNFPSITDETNEYKSPSLAMGLATCGVILFISSFICLLLTSKLWKGAEYQNLEKCQSWLIIRTLLVLISVASFTTEIFFGLFSKFFANGESALFSRTGAAAQILVNIYCIWIVHEYIQELKVKSRAAYRFQNLAMDNNI